MEILKEELENKNLMFTDSFKSTSMSISEFLSNPQYYKIMFRSNTKICVKLEKDDDEYFSFAGVFDSAEDKWVLLAYAVGESLWDSLVNLNGLKDIDKIDKKTLDNLQDLFDCNAVGIVSFFNSEKENKITAKVGFAVKSDHSERIAKGLVDKMVDDFNKSKRHM